MNLCRNANNASETLFLNFNQNNTSLALGTRTGFKLVTFESTDKLRIAYEDAMPDVFLVERLFSASMVAFVTSASPRKLCVYHFKTKQEIQSLSYTNSILAVRMNRSRLIICLEDSIFIHQIKDFTVVHVIKDTPINKNGLIALSYEGTQNFLAYPGSQNSGEIVIFDVMNYTNKIVIAAHDNPIAAMAFNSKGTLIATASEKGTVIRVFSMLNGQLQFEFRRGYARCVSIYSLCFSEDSLFLAASSNTQTVHIFKLEEHNKDNEPQNQDDQTWMSYINSALIKSSEYLPNQLTDLMKQWRSFATAMIPLQSTSNIAAISKIQGEFRVLVASADGYLYIYNLDVNNGGDCVLMTQHELSKLTAEAQNQSPETAQVITDTKLYDGEYPPI